MELCLNQQKKGENLIIRFIPYLLIIVASLSASFVLFYKGFPMGDDLHYHFSNIYDMYLDLKSGSISLISSRLASGLGFGKNLFYSPLSHLSTAILGIALEPFGISLLDSLKINLLLSVLISGIIMYRFALHLSNNKRIPALIAALVYVLYPYRYFDMLCRIALAESYAFIFMPLFFMGLYDFCHIDSKKGIAMPLLMIILGGSLLFLTHNITAIFSYFFGFIYLLFNITKIYKLLKENRIYILFVIISIFLLIGLASKTLFSAYSLYQTGLYNVSNPDRMWTSANYLANRKDFEWYSGLINLEYLTSFNSGITYSSAFLDAVYYSILTIGFILINTAILKANFMNRFSKIATTLLLSIACVILSFALFDRIEAILGVLLFHITYLYYLLNIKIKNTKYIDILVLGIISVAFFLLSMITYKMVMYGIVVTTCLVYSIYYTYETRKKKNRDSNIDLWYLLFVHIIVIVLIVLGQVWYIMPSFLRSIQFPWRLFGFLSLFSSMICAIILKDISKKYISVFGILASSFLMIVNQAAIEKRISYYSGDKWNLEISDKWYSEYGAIGACREYFPYMYYYDDNYESPYANSLYTSVKKYINNKPFTGKMHNLKPVFLIGDGDIEMEGVAPNFNITVNAKEKSLIELPLIYYPGYKIKAVKDFKEFEIESIETDGLVSFELEEGQYSISITYAGTNIMNFGKIYQYYSIYGLFIFISCLIIFDNKKRNTKENVLY